MKTQIDTLNIPVMMGYNSKDGLLMLLDIVTKNKLQQLDGDLARLIPRSVDLPVTDERCNTVANSIRNFYFNGEKLSEAHYDRLVDLLTDYHFTILSYLEAELHSRYEKR